MVTTTTSFAHWLDRFERLIADLRDAVEITAHPRNPSGSRRAAAADDAIPSSGQPDNLRDALRQCFGQLPPEFDTRQALRIVDGRFPQFRERDKSTRSQAIRTVAKEYGAEPIGKLGRNRSQRYRKIPE